MYPSVQAAFWPWLGNFEGVFRSDGIRFSWLGLDKLGRPATAYGCDLPSPQAMNAIVWRHLPNSTAPIATYTEIAHEWVRVDAMQAWKAYGGASDVFMNSAHLYYDVDSLTAWCNRKLALLEQQILSTIPNYATIPGLAQMARMRTSWADGGASPWPHLDAAISNGNWTEAQNQCMPEDLAVQTPAYVQSYNAVKQMYGMCYQYSYDSLPATIPNGLATPGA
jgi:hypothetical protein